MDVELYPKMTSSGSGIPLLYSPPAISFRWWCCREMLCCCVAQDDLEAADEDVMKQRNEEVEDDDDDGRGDGDGDEVSLRSKEVERVSQRVDPPGSALDSA